MQNITAVTDKGALLFSSQFKIPYDFFEKAKAEKNPNLIKIITYTNDTRKSINKKVHGYLFGNDVVWGEGEMIMFFDTYEIDNKTKIYNSSEGVIIKVGQERVFKGHFGTTDFEAKYVDLDVDVEGKIYTISAFMDDASKMKWESCLSSYAAWIKTLPEGSRKRREG